MTMTSETKPHWLLRLATRFSQGKSGIFAVGVAATLGVCLLNLFDLDWLHFQDLKLYDVFISRDRPIVRSGVPVIVDIDDASLAKNGQWPWPRYRVAQLLDALKDAGAMAVGIDIVFAETDRTSPSTILGQFEKDLRIKVDFSGLPRQLRDFDAVLARTLAGGPYALGYFLQFERKSAGVRTAGPITAADCGLPAMNLMTHRVPGAKEPEQYLAAASGSICPLPNLLQAAPAAGFFNAIPDEDNILRKTPLLLSMNGRILPSLALATIMEAYNIRGPDRPVLNLTEDGISSLTLNGQGLGKVEIPLDENGLILLNYRGPRGAFPTISAADVLDGKLKPGELAGKIVYLGTSAAGLKDLRASPLDRFMPGVEVHATITDMIVSRDFLKRPGDAQFLEVMATLILGVLAAALLAWTRAVFLLAPFAALGFGIWFGSAELLSSRKIFLSPLYPLIILALNFMLLTFLKFWREERQKRFIHSAFSHYLSPKVVEQIVDSPDKLTLTGEEREVSIIFTDVRGFTSISEKLSPTQVVNLLHRYLTPMTRIITDHAGTLDKFIGDAIMAFWNAPLDVPNHPRQAVLTALAMLEELSRLNEGFREEFGFEINIGIGLHCGRARVGNFGSAELFDYTIIGDVVNLCSRLESLTKYYGLRLLVSDAMARAAGEGFVFVEVDRVRVKGKHEPVTLFTALSEAERERRAEELALFTAALDGYKRGAFAESRRDFSHLKEAYGGALYALYAERCELLAEKGVDGEWDGVFTHTTK